MARYRATLAYDGTAYQGFQRQAGFPTIQGELEAALERLFGQPMTVIGAGRTDTGVHATGQVIAFDADWRHKDDALLKALNMQLPDDMAVQDMRQHADFHPRYNARSRMYRYDVAEMPTRQPLLRHRAWHIPSQLNREAMQAAAEMLVGEHDFATFGTPPRGDNTIRHVFMSAWQPQQTDYGTLLVYRVEATAFLQHMVRRIVAMLVDVGRGWLTVDEFAAAFKSADLSRALHLAPPHGLYLVEVKYGE
jgi:tRNA pseudouridine38-40 synthase